MISLPYPQIEELGALVKESRTDLDSLRAKFSLIQNIGRKKESELTECMKHVEELEKEVQQLKEKVT